MHQTTVRFSDDLWSDMEREAASLGVSVAQFVREAALARLTYNASKRGDADLEAAFESVAPSDGDTEGRSISRRLDYEVVRHRSESELESATALWGQGERARRRAQELRAQASEQRARRASPETEGS